MNAPTIYQALAIKGALKFYAKTGDYETAIKALDTFIQETTL
jgi:hypothetical protein